MEFKMWFGCGDISWQTSDSDVGCDDDYVDENRKIYKNNVCEFV